MPSPFLLPAFIQPRGHAQLSVEKIGLQKRNVVARTEFERSQDGALHFVSLTLKRSQHVVIVCEE